MTEQIATLRGNKPDVFKLTASLYIMIIYRALALGRLRQALPGAGSSRPAERVPSDNEPPPLPRVCESSWNGLKARGDDIYKH